jgi:hypothetical protein
MSLWSLLQGLRRDGVNTQHRNESDGWPFGLARTFRKNRANVAAGCHRLGGQLQRRQNRDLAVTGAAIPGASFWPHLFDALTGFARIGGRVVANSARGGVTAGRQPAGNLRLRDIRGVADYRVQRGLSNQLVCGVHAAVRMVAAGRTAWQGGGRGVRAIAAGCRVAGLPARWAGLVAGLWRRADGARGARAAGRHGRGQRLGFFENPPPHPGVATSTGRSASWRRCCAGRRRRWLRR